MSVADKPSMEGFLEKHSTGVSRLLGKTRFWCTLQGSCLVYCKENKRSSVVESIYLGDAQMVRKTSNDRQGVQFEIVMKKQKTYVFNAASTEECREWVRHLQQAMILNEPGSRRSEHRRQIASESGYDEIVLNSDSNPSFCSQRSQISVPQSGIYADVADALRPKSEGFPIQKFDNSSTGLYAEVADVIRPGAEERKSEETEEVVYRENSLYMINKEKENHLQETLDMGGGYSTLDNLKLPATKPEASSTETEELAAERKEETAADVPIYAQVNKQHRHGNQPPRSPDPPDDDTYANMKQEVKEGAAIEKLDSALKRLPIPSDPPVWDSLTADDYKPLEDLKDFLENNRIPCRSSYTRLTSEGDPIVKIKEIIQTLN